MWIAAERLKLGGLTCGVRMGRETAPIGGGWEIPKSFTCNASVVLYLKCCGVSLVNRGVRGSG